MNARCVPGEVETPPPRPSLPRWFMVLVWVISIGVIVVAAVAVVVAVFSSSELLNPPSVAERQQRLDTVARDPVFTSGSPGSRLVASKPHLCPDSTPSYEEFTYESDGDG